MSHPVHPPFAVRMSIDDATVILGVLRLVEPTVPPEVRPLSTRVIARVEHGLKSVEEQPPAPFSSLTTMEAEAVRLSELLRTTVAELSAVVSLLETVTAPGDRPVVMTTASRASLELLTERVAKLIQVDGGDAS